MKHFNPHHPMNNLLLYMKHEPIASSHYLSSLNNNNNNNNNPPSSHYYPPSPWKHSFYSNSIMSEMDPSNYPSIQMAGWVNLKKKWSLSGWKHLYAVLKKCSLYLYNEQIDAFREFGKPKYHILFEDAQLDPSLHQGIQLFTKKDKVILSIPDRNDNSLELWMTHLRQVVEIITSRRIFLSSSSSSSSFHPTPRYAICSPTNSISSTSSNSNTDYNHQNPNSKAKRVPISQPQPTTTTNYSMESKEQNATYDDINKDVDDMGMDDDKDFSSSSSSLLVPIESSLLEEGSERRYLFVGTVGTTIGVSMERLKDAKKELMEFKSKHINSREPNRGNLNDPNIRWRCGKPDYTLANLAYLKGRSQIHPLDSIEWMIENLVKTWEMEASHKADYRQWTTINHKIYSVQCNGGSRFERMEAAKKGNYNWLFEKCPKDLYDATKETFQSSHHLFKDAFPDGFVWEVLKVFSPPPHVVFTWRHWAHYKGKYKEYQGDGSIVELFGMGRITVEKNGQELKVCHIEIFFKPNEFLQVLEGKCTKHALYETFAPCPHLKHNNGEISF